MKIVGLYFTPSQLLEVRELIASSTFNSLRSLSRAVCEAFDWRNANGQLKETACRLALHGLENAGMLLLPTRKPRAKGADKPPSSPILPPIKALLCRLDKLGEVRLELVSSSHINTPRIWKELMDRHYLGSGPLCGAQLRYLVRSSEYGYVGALSFSSSSWTLKKREEYIGWSDCAREAHIQKVINNSRFLILPEVQVPNLASHVLGLCAQQVGVDWKARYGIEPVLLETFVDPRRYKGTCYKAANWIMIGKTSGRRGAEREEGGGSKDIYLYPLQKDWQKALRTEPKQELQHKQAPVNPCDWVEEELSGATFYDPRLMGRLLELTRNFYGSPLKNIPQSCGTIAKIKAAYRFFKNKRVTMKRVLHPHVQSTVERIKKHKVVLSVQDTSSLNYTSLHETEGLGPIGTGKSSAKGLLLHDTMAFTPAGVPLGLLDAQIWSRDPNDVGKKHRRQTLPIGEKESNKWLVSYRATAEAQRLCPDTTLVSVADRESDLYELFHEASLNPQGPRLLIRCESTRKRKTGEERLWEKMKNEAIAGRQVVHVPKRGPQPKREAILEVRHAKVLLTPPQKSELPSVEVWMVYALENPQFTNCTAPLEWMLLTTEPVDNFDDACERIGWYAKRWGIEIYHRTLKSGCRIEDRRLGFADSLEACIAIDMIVAWRIYHLTMLGRETPEHPCTVFFKEEEWKALYCYVNKAVTLPKDKPTLWETILMVASLGGFMGRKGDGKPGTTVLWRGMQELETVTKAYRVFMPRAGP